MSRIQELHDQGFDKSEDIHDWVLVDCSQCVAICINGVPCHETGCPNSKKHEHVEEED